MAPKKPMLDRMARNPVGDWSINDIETLCRQNGLALVAPTSGSHYKVTSDVLGGLLTVPYNRPIKPIYIRELVNMARAHQVAHDRRQKEK